MPSSPTPNSVRPKTVIFHTRFQTWAQKCIPVISTWRWSENATYTFTQTEILSSLLRLERQLTISQNTFRIRILHFRSYSTGIETTNTFIHYRSSLVNLTRFQTSQNGQNLYPFSDQNGAKTKPLGAAPTYMGYIRGYLPRAFTLKLKRSLLFDSLSS